MKKRRFAHLLALFLSLALLAPWLSAFSPALAASGTRIYRVEDLRGVQDDPGGTYILMADLDLSTWNEGWWEPFDFSGTFYGNGHTISGLQVHDTSALGLFAELSGQCTVADLTVRLGEPASSSDFLTAGGGIAAWYSDDSSNASLTLRNCAVVGDITSDGSYSCSVGGLVGTINFNSNILNSGTLTVTGCRVKGNLSIRSDDYGLAGGLVGSCTGGTVAVSGCSYEGNLQASHMAGGIFGSLDAGQAEQTLNSIKGCVVAGSISAFCDGEIKHTPFAEEDAYPIHPACQVWAGGILGSGSARIQSCQVSASISGESLAPGQSEYENVHAGGIVAAGSSFEPCPISECTVSGDITAQGPGAAAHGIAYGGSYENRDSYESCTVLGDISARSTVSGCPARAAGISIYGSSLEEGLTSFSNCTVYGIISAESLDGDATAGGIVATAFRSQFNQCVTYGPVSATSGGITDSVSTTVYVEAAGIAGGCTDGAVFAQCRSYGDITALAPNGAICYAAGIAFAYDPGNRLEACSAAGDILSSIPYTASRYARMEAAGLLLGGGGTFLNCAFTGTAACRYSDTGREYREPYAFCDEPSHLSGSIYNTSGLELCPDGTPAAQEPELPDGANLVVGSDSGSDYGQNIQNYYSKGSHYFRILVQEDKYPQESGFSITVGDQTYYTGDRNDLNVDLPEGYAGDVIISKEGFYSYTLPNEFLCKYNWILLWREGDGTRPVIQSVLQKTGSSANNFLLHQTANPIYENNPAPWTLTVQVDWLGQEPGEVWLQQGNRKVPVEGGTTGPVPLGTLFTSGGGTIYACAQNAVGELTRVATTLQVREQSQSVSLDMGESQSVTSPGSIDFLSNTQLSFDLPGIWEAEMSFQQDGTFSALIGLKSSDKLYHKQAVGGLKDLLDVIQTGGVGADVDGALKQYAKEYGLVPIEQNAKFSIPISLSVYGYLEGYLSLENGQPTPKITDGGCLVKGSGGWSYTQLFPFGLYAQTGLTNTLQFKMDWVGGQQQPAQVKNATSVKVGGGLGVPDLLSAGASGTGTLTVELELPLASDNWDVYSTYEVALAEVSVLGFGLTLHTIQGDKYYWVKDGAFALGESEERFLQSMALPEGETLSLLPRDYLDVGDTAEPAAMDSGYGDAAVQLKANIFPGTTVQLAALSDGSLLAVWVDDPGREIRPLSSNRTALHYAVYQNGTWSSPALVEEDGTGDFSPVLRVLGDSAYLVWMNAGQAFGSEEVSLEETASAMDIRVAVFDTNSGVFSQFATLSAPQDGVLDMLPDIALLDSGPVVVWLAENTGDFYNRSGQGSLYAAAFDKLSRQWEQPQLLAQGLYGVDSLTAGSSDGSNLEVWYSAGDPDDPEDKDIYSLSCFWIEGELYLNDPYSMTSPSVADTKPQWQEAGLSYYSGGVIQTPAGEAALDCPTDRFRYIPGPNGTAALLFAQADETGGTSLYVLFEDGAGWGSPIQAAQAGILSPSFSGAFDPSGRLHLFYSVSTAAQTETDGSLSVSTDLWHSVFTPQCDLAITRADYQTSSLISGGDLTYFVTVENRGGQSSSYLQVQVFDGETLLDTTVFLTGLAAGEQQLLTGICPLPTGFSSDSLTVEVTALGKEDWDLTDNSASLPLYLSDLSIQAAQVTWLENGQALVYALVANYGLTSVRQLPVQLLDGHGSLLDSQILPSLAPGQVAAVEFLSSSLVPGQPYTVAAAAQTDERSTADNRVLLLASTPASGLTLSQSSCRLEGGEITLHPVLDNPSDAGYSGLLIAALYSGNRLVEIEQLEISVDAYSTVRNTVVFSSLEDNLFVKLFYLDRQTRAPLTGSFLFQVS